MYILLDFHSFTKDFPSDGDLFCEDFFHALFRNHPQDIFYIWTTGEHQLEKKYRFEDYANVRRVHTAISSGLLYWLIRFVGYPSIDDLVETLAMKNGHLPWVAKFDVAFFSAPFPLLLEDDCFHVQFTTHLHPLHYPELYQKEALKYHSKKWYEKSVSSADLNIIPSLFAQEEIGNLGADSENCLISGIGLTQQMQRYVPEKQNMQSHIQHEHSFADMETAYKENGLWESLPEKFFFVRGDIYALPIVLKAFELFCARFPEESFSLLIEEPFENAFSSLLLPSSVEILSKMPLEEKEIVLSKCFAFIDPSFYETAGKEVLQAMRCGAVVISSNHGVFPEISLGTDLLFDPKSFRDLFHKMKKLYKNKNLQKELSEAGMRELENPQYSWDDITMKIMKDIQLRLEKREFEE